MLLNWLKTLSTKTARSRKGTERQEMARKLGARTGDPRRKPRRHGSR